MKPFFKILFITMMIQFGCFGINFVFAGIEPVAKKLLEVGFWIFLAGFPIAIIVDVVLAIRWGESLKQKLFYIFLMPTNYVGPMLALMAFLYADMVFKQAAGVV